MFFSRSARFSFCESMSSLSLFSSRSLMVMALKFRLCRLALMYELLAAFNLAATNFLLLPMSTFELLLLLKLLLLLEGGPVLAAGLLLLLLLELVKSAH